jgi:hypothetical protein
MGETIRRFPTLLNSTSEITTDQVDYQAGTH